MPLEKNRHAGLGELQREVGWGRGGARGQGPASGQEGAGSVGRVELGQS